MTTSSDDTLARLAAVIEARKGGDPDKSYVARLFAKVIGNPALMKELTRVGMHSRTLMDWVLRIMANLLREGKTFQIPSIMQTGRKDGQMTMDQAIEEKLKADLVTPEEAYLKSHDKNRFKHLLPKDAQVE